MPFDQAKIAAIALGPKSPNIYSQLRGGSIKLKGRWYNIKIEKEYIFQGKKQHTTTLELKFSFGNAREEYRPKHSIDADDKSLAFLKETEYKFSNYKLMCYFDEKYDTSTFGGDEKWLGLAHLEFGDGIG